MDYIIFKTCVVFVSRRVAKNVHRKKPKQAQFSGKKIRYINFSDTRQDCPDKQFVTFHI